MPKVQIGTVLIGHDQVEKFEVIGVREGVTEPVFRIRDTSGHEFEISDSSIGISDAGACIAGEMFPVLSEDERKHPELRKLAEKYDIEFAGGSEARSTTGTIWNEEFPDWEDAESVFWFTNSPTLHITKIKITVPGEPEDIRIVGQQVEDVVVITSRPLTPEEVVEMTAEMQTIIQASV